MHARRITGITASDKNYDGKTAATLNIAGAGFAGIVSGDRLTVATVTGSFSDMNPGLHKTVNITGLSLGGADARNYTLADTSAATTSTINATIAPPLTPRQTSTTDAQNVAASGFSASSVPDLIDTSALASAFDSPGTSTASGASIQPRHVARLYRRKRARGGGVLRAIKGGRSRSFRRTENQNQNQQRPTHEGFSVSAMFGKNRRKAHRLRAALSLPTLALAAGPAWAAPPPNAGTLLNNVAPAPEPAPRSSEALPEAPARPALKLDTTTKIAVKGIRITGITTYPESTLLPLVSDAIGKELTLAELDALAQRITRYYRDHGQLLARAYLPAQDIRNGEVEIAVLEGRVGKVTIEDTSRVSQARVEARLASIKQGEALNGPALERDLLLLSDLPGVRVNSTLSPGASVGTTDLDVRVAGAAPLSGSLGIDNYGSRYTGQPRLDGSVAVASPLHLGDSLGLDTVASRGLQYGRAAYQLPLNAYGTQLGAAFSALHYRLRSDFDSLGAHGTAYVSSLYLLHPLVRSRLFNVNAQVDFDHKALTDDIDSASTSSHKILNVVNLGLSGDRLDHFGGGGFTTWSATLSAGDLATDAQTRALDLAGHDTEGSYHKLDFSLARQQSLPGRLSLYGSLRVQHAMGNLDSAEKMVLGGPTAVRAYSDTEAPSDDAWLGTVELRYAFSANWQATAFFDAAQGYLNHHPIASDTGNKRRLSGAGIGLAYSLPRNLLIRAEVAWRTGARPTSDADRSPRAWLQAIKYF